MSGRANLEWAAALIDELVRGGVRWFIVAPGSRSAPLVLAAHHHPDARTVVQLDERSAAFFALGIGKATEVPAAVITTSGTATANLLPATVEAAQSEAPLILVTADRPARLMGGDANQAIDQRGLFGVYPKRFFDLGAVSTETEALAHVRQVGARVVASARCIPQGPVHVNVPFDKPLQPPPEEIPAGYRGPEGGRPDGSPFTRVLAAPSGATPAAVATILDIIGSARRPLVVAGPASPATGSGAAARTLATRWAIPLIADPLSGGRFESGDVGQTLIDHAGMFLPCAGVASALQPDLVLRFGCSPTSEGVTHLCASASAGGGEVVVFDSGDRWKDHRASVTHVVKGDPTSCVEALLSSMGTLPEVDPTWTATWAAASQAARAAALEAMAGEPFEGVLARAAARSIPSDGLLFVSSSMPIRDVDDFVTPGDFRGIAIGNRGASGIDGITSTALGVALGSERPLLCLMGDVAFLHDVGGLLAARSVRSPVVFVVVNNDGGGIFHMLPIRDHEPAFTKYFATPHGSDLRHAAALYRLPHATVEPQDLERNARDAFAAGGTHVIEVLADRARNRELRELAAERVQEAVRAVVHTSPGTDAR